MFYRPIGTNPPLLIIPYRILFPTLINPLQDPLPYRIYSPTLINPLQVLMPTYSTALQKLIPYGLYSRIALAPLQELLAIFSSSIWELMPYNFRSTIPRSTSNSPIQFLILSIQYKQLINIIIYYIFNPILKFNYLNFISYFL